MVVSTTSESRADRDMGTGGARALPVHAETFPALFGRRLAAYPNQPAFFDVTFRGAHVQATPHTWSEIDARARRAAAALSDAGVKNGDRVVLCLVDVARFFSFFLGAHALGAAPVPLPSAREAGAREAFRERIDSVVDDCVPRALVVDSERDFDAFGGDFRSKVAVIDGSLTDAMVDRSGPSFRLDRSPDEVAFIQYTSGSTGSPKGVVVTHGNLMANLHAIALAADLGPADRSFSWLPLYHDMGLIGGFLLGLYAGGEAYMMPTRTFVGRPASWLRGMSQFKATFASAPNFAYSLVARHLRDGAVGDLDLSHWRRAFNGAEPIDRSTLEAFRRRFASAHFSPGTMCPVYGLAECTLAVSIPEPGAEPRYDFVDRDALAREGRAVVVDAEAASATCFVSVGRAVPGHRVRILDPSADVERAERHLGEVAVSGPSVTPHYFRKDDEPQPPRRELRTGDLGYIAGGELFIVDRLKDLLILAGRNVAPSDLERVVARVPGTRYGAIVAFTIRGTEGTDELFLVVGVEPRAIGDERKREEIRAIVYQHFSIMPRDVVLVQPSAVPKTSSGKVRRAACRHLYETNAFSAAPAAKVKG